jgi:hypothetical protein
MGGECNAHGETRRAKAFKVFFEKRETERPVLRQRSRREDYIKIVLRDVPKGSINDGESFN